MNEEVPRAGPITAQGGWLSPGGVFYPCPSFEHTTRAWQIVRHILGIQTAIDAQHYLIHTGWCHIFGSGSWLGGTDGDPTQAQLDILHEMALLGGRFGETMQDELALALVMEIGIDPDSIVEPDLPVDVGRE